MSSGSTMLSTLEPIPMSLHGAIGFERAHACICCDAAVLVRAYAREQCVALPGWLRVVCDVSNAPDEMPSVHCVAKDRLGSY